MNARVVNLRQAVYDVYIGRSYNNTHYGNPFSHLKGTHAQVVVATREEAVKRFKSWLLGQTDHDVEPKRREWILRNLHKLEGRVLGCWCKPASCHGDVLVELLEGKPDKRAGLASKTK